jgi:hypothetical protein
MTLLLALTDHQETLYVAAISAVASITASWIAARGVKKTKDVHDIVERRKSTQPPDLHPQRRSDD